MAEEFFAKIVRGLQRDKHLPLGERIRKGGKLVVETAGARVSLRACDRVGAGARVSGRMWVENQGEIVIGDSFIATSTFLPIELLSGEGGRVDIGNNVWINFGTVVAAKRAVRIGNR